MQIVVVKFQDATTFNHWATVEAIAESQCKVCYACGILVEENKDVTKVALIYSQDKKSGSDWIDIPTPCVLSCEVIKEVDWEVPDV